MIIRFMMLAVTILALTFATTAFSSGGKAFACDRAGDYHGT